MVEFDSEQFHCDDCPICEGFERRLQIAEELGDDPQLEYCYCDKVGYKFWMGGYCGDAWSNDKSKQKRGKRKTGSEYRRAMKVKKRDDLLKIIDHTYKPTVAWVDWDYENGVWTRVGKYIKYPKNSNKEKFLKKLSNRRIRRSGELYRGNQYRKQSEYWWIIY